MPKVKDISKTSTSLEKQKLIISSVIHEKMNEDEISIQQLTRNIDRMGAAQISRVLHGENYNIMTLLKILDYFDLELDIKNKK